MRDFRWRKYLFVFFLCLVMTVGYFGLPGVSSASGKTVKLKVVTYLTPGYGDGFYAARTMVDYINLYGKSRGLSAELFHSQTVYKVKEILPALISGSIDIGMFISPYIEGSIPICGATDLPFIWGDPYTQCEGSRRGSPYFNIVNKECGKKNLQLLALASTGPEEFLARKPLKTLEDFKGLKVRVAGAAYAKALQSIGAVPISMPSSEAYTSLQRGLVDAVMGADTTFRARKLYEVAKYQTNMGAFQLDLVVMMNKGSFGRLSEEQKKVVWNAAEIFRHDFANSENIGTGYINMRRVAEKDYHVKQIYVSEWEKARFRKAMQGPTIKWWKKRVGLELGKETLKAIEESKNWRKSKFGYHELYPLRY